MSDIDITSQINLRGIGLIKEALIIAFERGRYGRGLDAHEQVQVDTASLIENLDKQGCQIVGKANVMRLEMECQKIIDIILKDIGGHGSTNIIESLIYAREQLERTVVMKRLGDCQELMKYVNGYDWIPTIT